MTEPAATEEPTTSAALVDLDAKRAARREGKGDAIEVRTRGEVFRLPIELPVDALEPLAQMVGAGVGMELGTLDLEDPAVTVKALEALNASLALLFGDEQWERFRATRPSTEDLTELLDGMFTVYGVTLGEALGSIASSRSDGPASNATSSVSTDSTPGTSGVEPSASEGS